MGIGGVAGAVVEDRAHRDGAQRRPLLKGIGAGIRAKPSLYLSTGSFLAFMAVEAKIGWFRHRVIAEGVEYPVVSGRRGWLSVVDSRGGATRVRYDGLRDQIHIEGPDGSLEIRIRSLRDTTFQWRGHVYRIASKLSGRILIYEDERVAAEGKLTSGGRWVFEVFSPTLRSIERELVLGLAMRPRVLFQT